MKHFWLSRRFAVAAIAVLVLGLVPSVVLGAQDRVFKFAGLPTTTAAGVAQTFDVTVYQLDATTPDPTYTGEVHFTSTDGAAVLPADYRFTGSEGDGGIHSFTSGLTLATVGSQTITVTDSGNLDNTGTSDPVTVTQGTPAITWTSTPPGAGGPTLPGSTTVGAANYQPIATSPSPVAVVISLDGSPTACSLVGGFVHFIAVGTCVIDANQTSNGNWNAAPQVQQTITVAQTSTTTTLSLTSGTDPSIYGDSLTFTAHVSDGLLVPAGSVQFFDGLTSLGTQALNGSGDATLTTSGLTVGIHALHAHYLGTTDFAASTSSDLSHTVTGSAPTTTTIQTSGSPSTYGTSVTFTATVLGVGAAPTSSVEFFSGATSVGFGTLNGLSPDVATLSVSTLSAGDHSMTAVYGGDTNYAGSTSTALDQVVNKATPVITWANPAAIMIGTALSATQLNATSGGVAGTFVYTPSIGTVLGAGNGQTLSVAFTPTDSTNYTATSKSVTIDVVLVGFATYHPMPPVRLLDTRSGNGLGGRLLAGVPATFQVAGRGGVPSIASGVTGNVTVVNSSFSWAVFLGPNPTPSPTTSTINFSAGQVAGNGLTVALSATGTLSATYMSTPGNTTDLVFDVTGYFTPDTSGDTFHPISPIRLLDTRLGNGIVGKLPANTPKTFQVAGRGGVNGVPANATGVTGNLTVVDSTFSWAVFLGPDPTPSPSTSTINFNAGEVKGNSLDVALSPTGTLSATYMSTPGNTTNLVFDVTGYFTHDLTGSKYVPLTPVRLLDTRFGNGLSGILAAGTPRTFTVTGRGAVPLTANGVTGNVTVVGETSGWAVFLGPDPVASPSTSTINFSYGDVKGNGLTVKLGSGGTLSATYISIPGQTTNLVFDVTGYFVP